MEQFWNRKRALNLSAAASGSSVWWGERAWRKVLPTAMIIDTTKNGRLGIGIVFYHRVVVDY